MSHATDDGHIARLRAIRDRLYADRPLDGAEMRDLGQQLDAIIADILLPDRHRIGDDPDELRSPFPFGERQADVLARALGGETDMSGGNTWHVHLTRSDGRFVDIGEDYACVYESRDHHDNYHNFNGPIGGGEPVSYDIPAFPGIDGRQAAHALAEALGGHAHHSGGNIWVVLYERPDGKFVVIGEEGCVVFPSRESYDRGDDESCSGVEWLPFEDEA